MATKKDPIHIKKSHEGLFGAKAAKAGMSTSAYASKESKNPNASPATKKQAVFAENAKSWKKK